MLKKILISVAFVLILSITACQKPSQDNVTFDTDPSSPYSVEDIEAFMGEKYAAAKQAFFWFNVSGMPPADATVDYNNIKEIDGQYYYKVGHETIKSTADLESYLKSLFSQDISQKLLEENKDNYIDINGELWAMDLTRGTNITVGKATFTISQKNDTKVVYTADVEELNPETLAVVGTNSYDYIYEKTADGWRWTEFSIYE